MRFFVRTDRWRPWVPLAFSVAVLVGDATFAVRPIMGYFEDTSVWPREPFVRSVAAYLIFATALDLLVWRFSRAARHHVMLRLACLSAVAAVLTLAAGEARSLPIFAVVLIFGVVALGRFTWPIAAAAAAVVLWPLLVRPAPPDPPDFAAIPSRRSPNLVAIVLDTVRTERTSAYGHTRDTTPHLRVLAARGVRFDRAYGTGSWSLPNHASLFTGLATERHGAHDAHNYLDTEHATLASLLAEHGYETVGWSGNPWLGHGTGMARGFHAMHEPWRTTHMKWFMMAYRTYNGVFAPGRDKGGADTLAGLRRWLAERDPGRPYFLFVNLMEPHGPYQDVPREMRRRYSDPDLSWRALESAGQRSWQAAQNGAPLAEADLPLLLDLYDGAIATGDMYLGEILALVGEEAIVAVLSDHGEFTGEHTLYGHPGTLYEPTLRIPFVMAGGPLPRSLVLDGLVSMADVMPTFLGFAGVAPPPGLDGIDLRPLLAGAKHPDRTITAEQFAEKGGQESAWRENRPDLWSLVDGTTQAVLRGTTKRIVVEDGTDVAFDLARDPGEDHPLPGNSVGLAARVPDTASDGEAPRLDEGRRRALEALGYVGER
jgi:arylsulfatase A-like enzyme